MEGETSSKREGGGLKMTSIFSREENGGKLGGGEGQRLD